MIETPSVEGPKLTGRGAARRTELFEELTALLIAEGFAAFTLDDLAARLRCSKRTLYGLAGSKEQLVRAAVVHFFRFEKGRIAEMWDVGQEIPSDSPNENGMF